ncbi:MAG: hypothetical protein BWZ10_01986 [candidate division BRC1 bacterium ADurb.BinA364]|nr:MAG: hypothetical protein BWZ10_01986 [candidate division BRC1 bacterium ADurb.BinA364]
MAPRSRVSLAEVETAAAKASKANPTVRMHIALLLSPKYTDSEKTFSFAEEAAEGFIVYLALDNA